MTENRESFNIEGVLDARLFSEGIRIPRTPEQIDRRNRGVQEYVAIQDVATGEWFHGVEEFHTITNAYDHDRPTYWGDDITVRQMISKIITPRVVLEFEPSAIEYTTPTSDTAGDTGTMRVNRLEKIVQSLESDLTDARKTIAQQESTIRRLQSANDAYEEHASILRRDRVQADQNAYQYWQRMESLLYWLDDVSYELWQLVEREANQQGALSTNGMILRGIHTRITAMVDNPDRIDRYADVVDIPDEDDEPATQDDQFEARQERQRRINLTRRLVGELTMIADWVQQEARSPFRAMLIYGLRDKVASTEHDPGILDTMTVEMDHEEDDNTNG